MIHGTSAVGARCWQRSQIVFDQTEPRRQTTSQRAIAAAPRPARQRAQRARQRRTALLRLSVERQRGARLPVPVVSTDATGSMVHNLVGELLILRHALD